MSQDPQTELSPATPSLRPGGCAPTVSLVLPTFNSAATLDRAIDSVLAQTFPDWELIVIDDGSTDGTPEVLAHAARRVGPRMVRVRNANRGPGAARNLGIELARGRYVAFLDADDELLPERFNRQVALLAARPELGLVFADYAYIDTAGVRHASVFDDLIPFVRTLPCDDLGAHMYVCGPELRDCMTGRYVVATITGMVRRDVLGDDIRFPVDLRYCEEWLFFLKVCRRAAAGYIDLPLALHHHTPHSLSRTSVQRNLEHRLRALEAIEKLSRRGTSRRAYRMLREQLAVTHRQLGFDHYKQGEFLTAASHFARVLRTRPGARSMVHWLQARARSLSLRPGRAAI